VVDTKGDVIVFVDEIPHPEIVLGDCDVGRVQVDFGRK